MPTDTPTPTREPEFERVRHAVGGFVRHREGNVRDDQELLPNASNADQTDLARDLRAFLEATFGVGIEARDMRRENFRSIDAITRLVERRMD